MKTKLSLLSEKQVFGEGFENRSEESFEKESYEVIRQIGAKCSATDFAIANGADIQEEKEGQQPAETSSADSRQFLRERSCSWFLSSSAGSGDVCVVNREGSRGVVYASSCSGIRPVLLRSDVSELFGNMTKDISGFAEAEFGEYPQYAADKTLARALESDYSDGRLRRTGKTYASRFAEFEYDGSKYIRAEYVSGTPHRLSNGLRYSSGDPIWLRVLPVKWLVDEENSRLISRLVLNAGMRFDEDACYDGEFEETILYDWLNTEFAADLIPSVLREMTEEEQAAYEEDLRMAAQRRNPYGLTFGEVTEEDIIRGAIESDVPVFLHGPSSEGKSARIKQIDPTCEIIYLRNATPDSLNGRSVYNQSTGEMIDIPPTWYRKVVEKCEMEPDRFHVVFFDEINNALPSIQGMAFNIVLDREVNGLWKLPENARVVAAGNDMQDSLAANQIAAPFFNRFAHVYINTTTEKWLRWARENHIHPAIYSFIAYRRGETLRSRYDGEKPNADPRKWEMASRMLYATGRPEMLRALIGEEITEEFVRFCNQPVITVEDVMNGNYTPHQIEQLNTAERYVTAMGLTQAEDEQLETVRSFVSELGEEFRAVFDSLKERGNLK